MDSSAQLNNPKLYYQTVFVKLEFTAHYPPCYECEVGITKNTKKKKKATI